MTPRPSARKPGPLPLSVPRLTLPCLALALLSACATVPGGGLPDETEAGVQTPRPLGSTPAAFGYYEYLPASYATAPMRRYPLLLFFHGSGEKGDGVADLPLVLRNGPPRLIDDGNWLDVTTAPFIVISPQSSSAFPSADAVHAFIATMLDRYRVDETRVYLTGLSAGAFTSWSYLAAYQDQVAAAVPIAGAGNPGAACGMLEVPVWAFHGDADGTVGFGGSVAMVDAINDCSPGPAQRARLTLYRGVGHDSWSRTYDLTGMGSAEVEPTRDPYDESIYDWLLAHRR